MLYGQNDRALVTNCEEEIFSGRIDRYMGTFVLRFLSWPGQFYDRAADCVIKRGHSEGVKRGLRTMWMRLKHRPYYFFVS